MKRSDKRNAKKPGFHNEGVVFMKKIWLLLGMLGISMLPGVKTDAAGLQVKERDDPALFVKEGGYEGLKEETILLKQKPFTLELDEAPTQSLEEYLVEQLEAMNPKIDVSAYHIPSTEAYEVYSSVVNRHPELYFVDTGLKWSSNGLTGMVMDLEITYEEYDRTAVQAELDHTLSLVDPEMSDLEKVVFIHDYLCMDVAYAYREAVNGTVAEDAHNLKGTVIDKLAVCDGYANTFLYYMQKLGIPCRFIANNSHAWNQVCLDGSWYMVDVTYDDTIWDYYGNVTHDYLLKSGVAFDGDDHEWDQEKYEACTDTTYDDAFWNGIRTQLINRDGAWYMVDEEGVLYRHEIGTHGITEMGDPVAELGGVWRVFGSTTRYYAGSYSKIDSEFGRLFYSQPEGIWCCKFDGSDKKKIADADTGLGMVYGMRIRDHQLQYEIAKVPNEEQRERAVVSLDTLLESGLECPHERTELRNVVEASVEQEGYTGDLYCDSCGMLLQKGSSYVSAEEKEGASTEADVTEESTGSEAATTEEAGEAGKGQSATEETGGASTERTITEEEGSAGTEQVTTEETGRAGAEQAKTEEADRAATEQTATEKSDVEDASAQDKQGGFGGSVAERSTETEASVTTERTTEKPAVTTEKTTTDGTAEKPITITEKATEKSATVTEKATEKPAAMTEKATEKPAAMTEKTTEKSSATEKAAIAQSQGTTTETAAAKNGNASVVTKVNLKNKKSYKTSFKVKIRHADGIKTVKLNGKKLKVKAGKKSVSFKLSKYKSYLKKKGKWNSLIVVDVNGKKTGIRFKTK